MQLLALLLRFLNKCVVIFFHILFPRFLQFVSSGAMDVPSSKDVYYSTKKIFEDCSFTWTVEHLSFVILGETCGFVIKSPIFPSDDKSKCKWQLFFYPCGVDAQHTDLISVELNLKSTTALSSPRIKTKCTLSFHDAKDNKLEELHLENVFTQGSKLVMRVIREPLFKKKIVEDDTLKIRIGINPVVDDSGELHEKDTYGQVKPEIKLIEDLSVMFLEQKLSDIVIAVKGTEFQAHQIILMARSPVLAAMLKHETKEKQEKRIVITDVEPEVMQKLLRFMYTSVVEFTNTGLAAKVLIAAEKYGLEGLKELAEEYLSFNLNICNVLDILNMADFHNALKLKARAIDFVCKTRESFSNVEKYSGKILRNPQLLVEVLAMLAGDSKPEKVNT